MTHRARAHATRARILDTAVRLFAEHGFDNARVSDISAELNIAKGSIFHHFGNKETLFLEVYKHATRSCAAYLDAPEEVRSRGFFEVLRYWVLRTEQTVQEDWISHRIILLGYYGVDLSLRRKIHRFLAGADPFGRVAFVKFGLERGELRRELDLPTLVSILDWVVERLQDALLVEELGPGLFQRPSASPADNEPRIEQFLAVLRRAMGAEGLQQPPY